MKSYSLFDYRFVEMPTAAVAFNCIMMDSVALTDIVLSLLIHTLAVTCWSTVFRIDFTDMHTVNSSLFFTKICYQKAVKTLRDLYAI